MVNLYCIFDLVAQLVEGPVIPFRSDAPAVRMFYDVMSGERSALAQHPGDFTLLCVGQQNPVTGHIEPVVPPRTVATGVAWLAEREMKSASAELTNLSNKVAPRGLELVDPAPIPPKRGR